MNELIVRVYRIGSLPQARHDVITVRSAYWNNELSSTLA